MSVTALFGATDPPRSVFAGVDVCREAGLALPATARRPMFDEDVWDFTMVEGLPAQMAPTCRRFDFTAITDTRWRLVAKELILAVLAPRLEAVARLPRAYRTPLHVNTAYGRLTQLVRWFRWLAARGVTGLGEVDDDCCRAYLDHRRYVRDGAGVVIGERSPATRRGAAQTVADLIAYREVFTADRVGAHLRPWGGATPSAVAQMPSGRGQNKTAPVDDSVLQPMMAAAWYLVTALGPHVVELADQVRDADRRWSFHSGVHTAITRVPITEITNLLVGYEDRDEPLPLLAEHNVADRLASGWAPEDPLTPIALSLLARQAGFTQFHSHWIPHLRDAIEATLRVVGAEKFFCRNAVSVDRADGEGTLPWTLPLHRLHAVALVGVVRTAAITIIAAVTGMRSSELMELKVGCRRPPETYGPDLVRYRLASKVVKGQPLGGLDDEWVVIEPVYQAVELAERLHDDPRDGAPLFGRFAFEVRHQWLRNWVNGPAGQRLGLATIPDSPVTLRMLRRTLAIELAYRPGGLLAAKLHLKHISVATTEGYASRPGGAQAELLAEVNKHEAERNLDLVWAEFRNHQQGILPAGPGARELTDFFAHIDGKLALLDAHAPTVQRNDREVLNLLSKRANTLHLGVANYCWFTDPSRALCLKLAGTPHADRPLAGMCDSTRCPQAPTIRATGRCGPSTRIAPPPSSAASGPPARPRRPVCKQITTGPYASWQTSTRPPTPAPRSDVRISAQQRQHNQVRIRAAIDRLLRGDIPIGGGCDVTTLAREAGVDRTALYGTRPYAHLREEFEQRLQAMQCHGEHPDPRDAQVHRLKTTIDTLQQRITRYEQTTAEAAQFRQQALSRLAAQHDEITRLRAALERASNVRRLPTAHS